MDRFIDNILSDSEKKNRNLKSNMDRFIEKTQCYILLSSVHLKSNMDRFIASAKRPFMCSKKLFKIQYG